MTGAIRPHEHNSVKDVPMSRDRHLHAALGGRHAERRSMSSSVPMLHSGQLKYVSPTVIRPNKHPLESLYSRARDREPDIRARLVHGNDGVPDAQSSGIRLLQAHNHLEQRRFASAVGANDACKANTDTVKKWRAVLAMQALRGDAVTYSLVTESAAPNML